MIAVYEFWLSDLNQTFGFDKSISHCVIQNLDGWQSGNVD